MSRSRLFTGDREIRWHRRHLGFPEQRFDLVLRKMLPVGVSKRESLLSGEPDPPRRPGVKGQPVPGRLAAEASSWCALFDVVLQKDRRSKRCGKWRRISSGARSSAMLVTEVELFCGS